MSRSGGLRRIRIGSWACSSSRVCASVEFGRSQGHKNGIKTDDGSELAVHSLQAIE